MNESEFDRWRAKHTAYFPGLRGWFRREEKDEPGSTIETLAVWAEALEPIALDEALDASKTMYENPGKRPGGYGDHGARVRQLAFGARKHDEPSGSGERQRRFVTNQDGEDEEVFDCPICRDDGHVLCLSSVTMRALIEKPDSTPTLYTVAAPCSCRLGGQVAYRQKLTQDWQRYHPDTYMKLDTVPLTITPDIREWCGRRDLRGARPRDNFAYVPDTET